MNGGNLYIPIDIDKPNGNLLAYEVRSGAYLSDIGVDLLASSLKIKEIIQLSNIIPGLQFKYSDIDKIFKTNYLYYLNDFLDGVLENNQITESLKKSVQETIDYLYKDENEKALNTDFAKLSVKDKIEKNLTMDRYHTKIINGTEFWENNNITILNTMEATEKLLSAINSSNEENEFSMDDFESFYYWKDGQFFTQLSVQENEEYETYIIPLIVAILLMTDESIIDSQEKKVTQYLLNITDVDKNNLDIIKDTLTKHNIKNSYLDINDLINNKPKLKKF